MMTTGETKRTLQRASQRTSTVKMIANTILVGVLTTICRIIAQMLIPNGTQTVLQPSVFVLNGTMPIAFTVYGIFAFSIIASLYFFVERKLSGSRIIKGLKYGAACAATWTAYLMEPLPHASPLDRITYPIADGAALLLMGLLLGLLCSRDRPEVEQDGNRDRCGDRNQDLAGNRNRFLSDRAFPVFVIALCFTVGRICQYLAINTYSSFASEKWQTLIWAALTGCVIAVVMLYLKKHLAATGRMKTAWILGGMIYGIDLLLFNFFMPLVFTPDLPDLIVRTLVDVIAVTVGIYLVSGKERINTTV